MNNIVVYREGNIKLMRKMYAISYYGERYKLGIIQMDFLAYDSVNRMIHTSVNQFWQEVDGITADVPLQIYNRYIYERTRTLEYGSLFVVYIEENGKAPFDCKICFGENSVRYSRISIVKAEKCSDEERETIVGRLREYYDITAYDYLESHNMLEKAQIHKNMIYTFKVHNVGQALSTSLEKKGEKPFLYFDYGCDAKILATGITVPEVDVKNTVIFLSHVDDDHWCGSYHNIQSLKCVWIVPKQNGRVDYRKFLSAINKNGGKVYWHDFNIDLGAVYIGNQKNSTIKPGRIPKPTHQDGYAMYINGYVISEEIKEEMKKEYKITVSGDQDYDYQDPNRYNQSDILVACHHGGTYCWSKRFKGIFPADSDAKVIYSYGCGNKHRHPSKCHDYYRWGWKLRHDTPFNGTYEIDICL